MDIDTINQQKQPAQPEQCLVQDQSTQSSSVKQVNTIPVIIGVIILLFVVAGGSYYFGLKRGINSTPHLIPPQTITPINTPIATSTSSNSQSQIYENNDQKISFEYSPDWVVNYKDAKHPMNLCDLNAIIPLSAPSPGIKYGACEASGVTPTTVITFGELLDIRPKSSLTESSHLIPAIQLSYYSNPENLTIQEFNSKYLSETIGGDPVNIWSVNYETVTNKNGVTAFYDKEHYCVAMCQVYVFSGNGKIFILKNFPTNAPNQQDIFDKVFSSFKFTS